MEQRGEQGGQTEFEKLTIQSPTFKEWLHAVFLLPVTLISLVEGINGLTREMKHYRQLPECLTNLDEVGRDFNTGFYHLLGGQVNYKRFSTDPDSK